MLEEIRAVWDDDAAHYDEGGDHDVASAAERAAWLAVLAAHLPAAPARVLDVGAGTGFLTLLAASLGHEVTALDISPGMLARLRAKAAAADVAVRVVEGPADAPPPGPFDAVMQRHVLWTTPDPVAALRAWHCVAPEGRLLLFESVWGDAADPMERLRGRGRMLLRRLRGAPSGHHREYPLSVREALPLGRGTTPEVLVEYVTASGWGPARVQRLRDVEWARLRTLPPWDRALGVPPRFLVAAEALSRSVTSRGPSGPRS